jgi:hypothetical protein
MVSAFIPCLAFAFAANLAAEAQAGPATRAAEMPANAWVPMNEPSMGVQLLGWDEIRYVPELRGIIVYGAFRSYTSENQNAIWLYRFNENRWRLLHINMFNIRDEMASDGGHTADRMVWDRSRNVLVYGGLCSMSRNDRCRTWVFDPLALVGWDANPPPPAPYIPYDAASAYLPEWKRTFAYQASRGTWTYDAMANQWKQLVPPGKGPADTAEVVYDAKRSRLVAFGGAVGEYGGKAYKTFNDLWAFDLASKTWQKLEAKNPPPARSWPSMAISTAADVILMTGGLSGGTRADGNFKLCDDTWVLDLETIRWEQVDVPASPIAVSHANHLVYDPVNDVFLRVAAPPKNLGYGYQTAMYAFRYGGNNPVKPGPLPVVEPAPVYDLAALPKAEGQWMRLGDGPVTAVKGWALRPSLAAQGKDLLLAFQEYDPPGKYQDEGSFVYGFRYADGQWGKVSGRAISDAGQFSQTPSAGFDSTGKPVVAYQSIDPFKAIDIIVKRFDGGQWAVAGTPTGHAKTLPAMPSLVGGPGELAVAWQCHPGYGKGMAIYVAENSGDAWPQVVGGLAPGAKDGALNVGDVATARAQFVSLARDSKGRLVAAWQEQKAGSEGENATPERIHVRRFEKGQWAELAKELPTTAPDRAFSYAMTLHDGEPVVAACEGTDGGRAKLIVRAWKRGTGVSPVNDGQDAHAPQDGQWMVLGDGPLNVLGPEGGTLKPALASDGKNLYVAWPEFLPSRPPLLFVKKWDGARWTLIGGPLNDQPGQGAAHNPTMAVLDGKPVVAWTEHVVDSDSLRQLFVKELK